MRENLNFNDFAHLMTAAVYCEWKTFNYGALKCIYSNLIFILLLVVNREIERDEEVDKDREKRETVGDGERERERKR